MIPPITNKEIKELELIQGKRIVKLISPEGKVKTLEFRLKSNTKK